MVLSSFDFLLGFSFFWKFSLHSSQDFQKHKETLEEEKFGVCSFCFSPCPWELMSEVTL